MELESKKYLYDILQAAELLNRFVGVLAADTILVDLEQNRMVAALDVEASEMKGLAFLSDERLVSASSDSLFYWSLPSLISSP